MRATSRLHEAIMRGTERIELERLRTENRRLRFQLRLSTNGLRTCSRWNISEETARAIMAVVMENETLLGDK